MPANIPFAGLKTNRPGENRRGHPLKLRLARLKVALERADQRR